MHTFTTSREISAPVDQVFAAMKAPERLARWWGPAGFKNTFEICEFRSGGNWRFTMHGPDGRDYANESVFAEVTPHRIVIRHTSLPKYELVIGIAASNGKTLVTWSQTFEKAEVAKAIEHIVVPANEQNLDRLSSEVLNPGPASA